MDGQTLKTLVAIFLAAILTENYVLNKFLGICPFLGVSKKLDTAFGMSCAVTVVMVEGMLQEMGEVIFLLSTARNYLQYLQLTFVIWHAIKIQDSTLSYSRPEPPPPTVFWKYLCRLSHKITKPILSLYLVQIVPR